MIVVTVPIKIISEANTRSHWRVKARRVAQHRGDTHRALKAASWNNNPGSWRAALRITMTRIAPRQLDDDNLASGFKAARDGVADWLGIDDGSPLLTWAYSQRKGGAREYAAEVRIERVSAEGEA